MCLAENGNGWKGGGAISLLAKWITNQGYGYEMDWYYDVKDNMPGIDELKLKRCHEIRKEYKNFTVRKINP